MFWWLQKNYVLPAHHQERVHCSQERWYLIFSGACRKETTSSRQARKPRIGQQAGWESTGPGQTGVRHGLAIKKKLCRQPLGNTSLVSLVSQTKCGRTTTRLWLLRGKLCGVVKNLGNQASAWQIHASNSYPTFQGSAMQCPGCVHHTARQMEEEGSTEHALLSGCCSQERYTK